MEKDYAENITRIMREKDEKIAALRSRLALLAPVVEAAKNLVAWKRLEIAGDEFDYEDLVRAVDALATLREEGGRP